MNFQAVLKGIFPTPPTLEEFINAHNPESILNVEFLERQYDELIRQLNHPHSFEYWN